MFPRTAETDRDRCDCDLDCSGNKEMSVAACAGNVASALPSPPCSCSLCSAKVTSHRITEFREGISSSSSYLSVLRNLFSPSVTVPNLSFSSFPGRAGGRTRTVDHLPRGGGYSFAVTRASLDTNSTSGTLHCAPDAERRKRNITTAFASAFLASCKTRNVACSSASVVSQNRCVCVCVSLSLSLSHSSLSSSKR